MKLKKIFLGLMLGTVIVMTLTTTRADTLRDPKGNSIQNDIISPCGGGMYIDNSGIFVNFNMGQCLVGKSDCSIGSLLFHGIQYPLAFSATIAGLILY